MKSAKLLIAVCLCLTLTIVSYFYFARPSVAGPDGKKIYWPPVVGETFPNIVLTDQNGESTSLHDFRGKVMLVQITSMASPVCQSLANAEEYGPFAEGTADASYRSVQKYLEDHGVSWQDDRLAFVQILAYDMNSAPPTDKATSQWAKHFNLDRAHDVVVLQGNQQAQRFLPESTVPTFYLLDKKFMLRASVQPNGSQDLGPSFRRSITG